MLNGEHVKRGDGLSYGEYDANDRLLSMSGFFYVEGREHSELLNPWLR